MKYTPMDIKNYCVEASKDGKTWKPARGLNYQFESLYSRLKNAWYVFIGKYDVLDWEGY